MEIVAILHNIRSLHNVGSIFRTADAAGVKKIYLCGITPAPVDRFGKLRPQFAKVALGAERYVVWEKRPAFSEATAGSHATSKVIGELKKDGYKILAVEQSRKSIPYYKFKSYEAKPRKIAVVMGNELRGLPSSIMEKADKVLEIPMRGKKESLNVAVAFGIVVYFLRFLADIKRG